MNQVDAKMTGATYILIDNYSAWLKEGDCANDTGSVNVTFDPLTLSVETMKAGNCTLKSPYSVRKFAELAGSKLAMADMATSDTYGLRAYTDSTLTLDSGNKSTAKISVGTKYQQIDVGFDGLQIKLSALSADDIDKSIELNAIFVKKTPQRWRLSPIFFEIIRE